jgi:alpha-tubulin suppressor-like RCC1 family protein
VKDVAELRAGGTHVCARSSDGAIKCWGSNGHGQLGDGTTKKSSKPVAVKGLKGAATAIAAGTKHSCALMSDKSVRCWGAGPAMATDDAPLAPRAIAGVGDVADIDAGGAHTCVLGKDKKVRCWGEASRGRLGAPPALAGASASVVEGIDGAAQIAVGGAHACARLGDGTIKCWGANDDGQCGDGSAEDQRTPVAVKM